jgi:pyruvate kinase
MLALGKQNRTKIVATMGPASCNEATLRSIFEEGVDAVRLNFSHSSHSDHHAYIRTVRSVAAQCNAHIAIIADLQGPKIRTGLLKGGEEVELVSGEELVITTRDVPGTSQRISTTYQALPSDVDKGDRILLDDGALELQATQTTDTEVHCQVVIGGTLGEHKGINLPGVSISAPALTDKDHEDLRFALENEVDYVALSFVRSTQDIRELKALISEADAEVPVIAKLEKPEAISELEEIVTIADAIMVARGDLGVEIPPEEVPILQKQIISLCSRMRKPVITATQMLDSMRTNPRPTRAETSDVANAILDGTDAVMLSGETAIGSYPVESVAMMRRIAAFAEQQQLSGQHLRTETAAISESVDFADALSRGAARIAERVKAEAIIAFTQSGSTARLASKCRPRCPIIAATPLESTARRCNLYWGVQSIIIEPADNTDEMIAGVEQRMRELGIVESGDVMIITAGTPIGAPGTTNMMKLQVVS